MTVYFRYQEYTRRRILEEVISDIEMAIVTLVVGRYFWKDIFDIEYSDVPKENLV